MSIKKQAMIEVFKTNVQEAIQAKHLVRELLEHFPSHKINFDLDDCDKILRVEGTDFCKEKIIELLNENGYLCEALA